MNERTDESEKAPSRYEKFKNNISDATKMGLAEGKKYINEEYKRSKYKSNTARVVGTGKNVLSKGLKNVALTAALVPAAAVYGLGKGAQKLKNGISEGLVNLDNQTGNRVSSTVNSTVDRGSRAVVDLGSGIGELASAAGNTTIGKGLKTMGKDAVAKGKETYKDWEKETAKLRGTENGQLFQRQLQPEVFQKLSNCRDVSYFGNDPLYRTGGQGRRRTRKHRQRILQTYRKRHHRRKNHHHHNASRRSTARGTQSRRKRIHSE